MFSLDLSRLDAALRIPAEEVLTQIGGKAAARTEEHTSELQSL